MTAAKPASPTREILAAVEGAMPEIGALLSASAKTAREEAEAMLKAIGSEAQLAGVGKEAAATLRVHLAEAQALDELVGPVLADAQAALRGLAERCR